MTIHCEEVLKKLQDLSDPRAVVIWSRMGMPTDKYLGVGLTKLKEVAKEIKKNHDLALQLWNSGVHDAALLATMIEDPKKVTREQIEEQTGNGFYFYDLADKYSKNVIAKTPYLQDLIEAWKISPDEYKQRSAYILLSELAKGNNKVEDETFIECLLDIKANIQQERNWVKEGMLYALIGIGSRNRALNRLALDIAEQVGPITVDYGETSCQTPDPIKYLTHPRLLAKLA